MEAEVRLAKVRHSSRKRPLISRWTRVAAGCRARCSAAAGMPERVLVPVAGRRAGPHREI